jgi:hypothetical protein
MTRFLRSVLAAIRRAFQEPEGPVSWVRIQAPDGTTLYIPVTPEEEPAR